MVQPSDRERLGVTVHMDYAFMMPEEKEETMQPTLVVYDDDIRLCGPWLSSRRA